MARWILDTDHVSLALRNNKQVLQIAAERYPDVATTIITVQELFNGWVGRINQETDPKRLVDLYGFLTQTVDFLRYIPILPFDHAASKTFVLLKQRNAVLSRKRLDKDMRIASIALTQESVMVTRNHKDFSLIDDLQIEDWTVESP